jgi:hypothetical protein
MWKLNLLFLSLIAVVFAQAQDATEYSWTRIKTEFPPLSPLPPEKTFDIELPEALTYVKGQRDVRTFWSPYGLVLQNKWDTKNPASYTFRMKLEGMKVIAVEMEERKSNITRTGKEFFRHYIFNFPATVEIVDNEKHEVVRTITIASADDEFKRTLHRNIFITDSFDPNYKKVVGYDSASQLKRIPDNHLGVLKQLEGSFASEVIFEKIKMALVQLYGSSIFKADFCAMNPKVKNRRFDFSDYDAASKKLSQAHALLKENFSDLKAKILLDEAEKFYQGQAQNPDERFQQYVPAMVYWNLAETNLLKGDFEAARKYFEKTRESEKAEESFKMFCVPAFNEANNFLHLRSVVGSNKVSATTQKVARAMPPKVDLSKGFLVLPKGDTLFGGFKEFQSTTKNHAVAFVDSSGKEMNLTASMLQSASAEGAVFEALDYKFNGVFSGDQMVPGKKLMLLLYASPDVRFYFYAQANEYIYFFPKKNVYKRYAPFSKDEGVSLTNYNNKLSQVFEGCEEVIAKIKSDGYQLKKENSSGHILALTDFENSCGSKQFEKYATLLNEEVIKAKYRNH